MGVSLLDSLPVFSSLSACSGNVCASNGLVRVTSIVLATRRAFCKMQVTLCCLLLRLGQKFKQPIRTLMVACYIVISSIADASNIIFVALVPPMLFSPRVCCLCCLYQVEYPSFTCMRPVRHSNLLFSTNGHMEVTYRP